MAEWVRTNDGTPLKTTDAMLDKISGLLTTIAALELELATYREADHADAR